MRLYGSWMGGRTNFSVVLDGFGMGPRRNMLAMDAQVIKEYGWLGDILNTAGVQRRLVDVGIVVKH